MHRICLFQFVYYQFLSYFNFLFYLERANVIIRRIIFTIDQIL